MKLKKGVRKTVKIFVIVLIILILAVVGYFGYKRFYNKNSNTTKPEIVDKLDGYGYELEENESKTYKKLFAELKKILNQDNYDEELYAKLVSQLLVEDFYNLDEKLSKNDVGGVQFIRKEQQENFVLEASETVYKYIEHNIYGKRTQELPVVSTIEVKYLTETTYKYKDISDEKAYKVVVNLTYEKDLGYPTEITVVLIHNTDNPKKLDVIKMY